MKDSKASQPILHAILIGINAYPDRPLKGCVRDIQYIKTLLGQHSAPIDLQAFTATPSSPGANTGPVEDPSLWPTYNNVTAALEETTFRARPGDRVYIHYSGHGTRFTPTSEFSNRSTGDLALALLDGEKGTAIKPLGGHRLAMALNAMVMKELIVTLVLDCCFAASAYRLSRPNVRFISLDPKLTPSLPVNASPATQNERALDSGPRDVSMLPSWLMDPNGYALLAACGPHEEASELIQDGKDYGALSRFLYLTLKEGGLNKRHKDIYRHLCVKFQRKSLQQSPTLYGNKDQGFFGQCSSMTPRPTVPVVRSGQRLILQAGQAHGVSNGDDFILYPLSEAEDNNAAFHGDTITAKVDTARQLTSSLNLGDVTTSLTIAHWVAEPQTQHALREFSVSLSKNLPRRDEWLQAFDKDSLSVHSTTDSGPFSFRVALIDGEYKILDRSGQEVMNLPAMPQGLTSPEDVSAVLEHLAKYELVRNLANQSPVDDFLASFDINIATPAGDRFSPSCVIDLEQDSSRRFMFMLHIENKGTKDLYVYMFTLGPFWEIEDMQRRGFVVTPPSNANFGSTGEFIKRFAIMMPEEIKEKGHCEDTLKVLVTSQPTSFDLLKLPEVECLPQKQSPSRGHRPGKDCPEQWEAFNFTFRTSLKPLSDDGESSRVDTADDGVSSRVDTDLESIFSEGFSISSKTESSFGRGQRDAVGLLATLLFHHEDLSPLYTAASTKVSLEKLQRHLRGSFRKYGDGLTNEAESRSERRAAAFVRGHARYIAREISLRLVPNDWETAVFRLPTEPSESSKQMINNRLVSAPEVDRTEELLRENTPQRLDKEGHDDGYGLFEDEEDEYEEAPVEDASRETYQALEMTKEFLLSADAFRVLQQSLRRWLKQDEPETKGKDRDPTSIADTSEVEQQKEPDQCSDINCPEKDQTPATTQLNGRDTSDSAWARSIAALWYGLMKVLDPPPNGAQRVTYTCGCGHLQYLDVEELIPGGAAEFQQALSEAARAVRQHTSTPGRSSGTTAVPQAHLTSSKSGNGKGQACSPLPFLGSDTPSSPTTNSQTAVGNHPTPATREPKYLLICINTKRGLAKLEHIDVSSITNDQFLFEEILRAYSSVRREHEWEISHFLPKLIPFRSLLGPLGRGRLFIPKRVEFVQFRLMPVRTEIYAGSMVKPDIPGEEEVLHKRTYEYRPVPLNVRVLQIPAHELLKPGPHLNCFWRDRFPKKLKSMLLWDEQAECLGWGIHITEDWNKPLANLLALLVMLSFGAFVIIYGVLAKDWGTGATIGSFLVAIFVLYCTLQYQWWIEQ